MRLPISPALLPFIGIAAAGVGLALVFRTLEAEASEPIIVQGGVRFWNANLADAIAKQLAGAHVELISERSWRLKPGAAGGEGNALELARAIQLRGNQVVATDSLLEQSSSPRGMSEVLPTELDALASAEGVAVLPKL